jgi:hypothetical protein
VRVGLVVVLAGAAAGYGGDRKRPVAGVAVRGSRRPVGLAAEGRGEQLPSPSGETPGGTPAVYGGLPWPFFRSQLLAPVLAVRGWGRQARRAEGAPLKL